MDVDPIAEAFGRHAAGEPEALGALYDAAVPLLYAVALWRTGGREEAADVVQDVFVELARRRHALRHVRSPRTYLLAMAYARAGRSRKRTARLEPLHDQLLDLDGGDPVRALDGSRAMQALSSLSPPQRTTVLLHLQAGLSFREIGEITGVPTFTAASRFRLGIAALRRMLGVS